MPYMSNRDRNDILFGIEQGLRSDFCQLRAQRPRTSWKFATCWTSIASNIRIIAKIENQEASITSTRS